MKAWSGWLSLVVAAVAWGPLAVLSADPPVASPYARWSKGPSTDPAFFPIAVWLQSPANAVRYRQAGFNTYVGLWRGPTEDQLTALRDAGMRVICEQNRVGLDHRDDPVVMAWMHGDEPDNAQSLGEGKGYGPPISPESIVSDYQRIRAADPTRPVLLNLGQGVAWDGWYGRGVRSNHPEDYPEYAKGGDIVSFDIYPANHDRREVAGQLWYVGYGVERLIQWSGPERVVWNCIECSAISDPARKPTPHQVRSEVWMSLIHGSRGLIYFVHQFKPVFREAALFDDPAMLETVTTVNRQIRELAPVLNGPDAVGRVTVRTEPAEVPVAIRVKRDGAGLVVLAVGMRAGTATATFHVKDLVGTMPAEVLGENRTVEVVDGQFSDTFKDWDAHLYRVRAR